MTPRTLLFFALFFATQTSLAEDQIQDIHVFGATDQSTLNEEGEPIESHSGTSELNEQILETTPSGNGNMNEVLRILPEVTYTDPARTSKQAGEIKPGEVSILGARPYQNNFIVDGSPNNSIINPASKEYDSYGGLPGHAQEQFLDLNLIESITVYSSNVSAKYGQFSGGVVEAKTKRAKFVSEGHISGRHTSDNWTQFHLDKQSEYNFNNATSTSIGQPKFDKWQYGAFINQPINDNSAFYVNFQHQESKIPVYHLGQSENEYRKLDNWMAKYSHYFEDDSTLDVTASYSPYEENRLSQHVKDSEYTLKGGGRKLNVEFEKGFGDGILTSTLSVNDSESTRTATKQNFYIWAKTDSKPWGKYNTISPLYSREGGKGQLTEEQSRRYWQLDYLSESFALLGSRSVFNSGFELNHVSASKRRNADANQYLVSLNNDDKPESGLPRLNCQGADACIEGEQYASHKNVYQNGSRSAEILNTGAFLENTFDYQRWLLRLGARYDYNDYMQNQDLAYRTFTKIDLIGNQQLFLTGGLNRYYESTFLTQKLNQSGYDYQQYSRGLTQGRDQFGLKQFTPTDWRLNTGRNASLNSYSELDTPFTDEQSIGIEASLFAGTLVVENIQRHQQKQFVSDTTGYQADGFKRTLHTNDGWAKHNSWKATWEKQFQRHFFSISYFHSEGRSNFKSSYLDEADVDNSALIAFNGKIIDANTEADVVTPDDIKLVYSYQLNNQWQVGLFGQWTQGYEAFEPNGLTSLYRDTNASGSEANVSQIAQYDNIRYEEFATLDASIAYRQKIAQGYVQVNLDVSNVFNGAQKIIGKTTDYALGRQIWLGLQVGW